MPRWTAVDRAKFERDEARQHKIAKATASRRAKLVLGGLGPVVVEGLEIDGRRYDVEVTWNDVDGVGLHKLTVYDEPPGSGLSDRDLSVPLRTVALEAVAAAAERVLVRRRDGSLVATEDEFATRVAMVRDTMRRQQRTSWTPSVSRLFLARYRELLAAGESAIHRRLGDEFGVTPARSASRLAELRAERGEHEVPKAPAGRPAADQNTSRRGTRRSKGDRR
jgi:hypothetical protein